MPADHSATKPITIIGCGYIGKLLARQLLKSNKAVAGIVSSENSLAECQKLNIPCSITDLDEPASALNLQDHYVIYLAPPPSHRCSRAGKRSSTEYLKTECWYESQSR